MSAPPERPVYGRNYLETLLISLRMVEARSPTLETMEAVLSSLEEEVCAIRLSIPLSANLYHGFVQKLLSEFFPELPAPELKGCFLYRQVYQYLRENARKIMGPRYDLLNTPEIDREVKTIAIRICRSAIAAALYHSGVVSLK